MVGWGREGGALGADRGAAVGTGAVETVRVSHGGLPGLGTRSGFHARCDGELWTVPTALTFVKITLILGEGQTTIIMQEKQGGR